MTSSAGAVIALLYSSMVLMTVHFVSGFSSGSLTGLPPVELVLRGKKRTLITSEIRAAPSVVTFYKTAFVSIVNLWYFFKRCSIKGTDKRKDEPAS